MLWQRGGYGPKFLFSLPESYPALILKMLYSSKTPGVLCVAVCVGLHIYLYIYQYNYILYIYIYIYIYIYMYMLINIFTIFNIVRLMIYLDIFACLRSPVQNSSVQKCGTLSKLQ